MKKKVLLAVPAAMAVLALALLSPAGVTQLDQSNPLAQEVGYTGRVCVQYYDGAKGAWTDRGCSHNLITNYGLELVKSAVNGTSANVNLTNLTVGGNTSAMAATDTDLANIYTSGGLNPALAVYARTGTGNSTLNYQWTSSGAGTYNVNSTGIYNVTGAGGKLFAEAYFSNTALNGANGDKLNVTYAWWIA